MAKYQLIRSYVIVQHCNLLRFRNEIFYAYGKNVFVGVLYQTFRHGYIC